MALENKQMVTPNTINTYRPELIKLGVTLPSSDKAMTKTEVMDKLFINQDLLSALTTNQLVKNELLNGYGYRWSVNEASAFGPNNNILIGGSFDYGPGIGKLLVLDNNLRIIPLYSSLARDFDVESISTIHFQPVVNKILLGFTTDGITRFNYRLNDGMTIDSTFSSTGYISGVFSNGKVLVTIYSGTTAYLQRLNIDGSVDNTWLGTGHIVTGLIRVEVANTDEVYLLTKNYYGSTQISAIYKYDTLGQVTTVINDNSIDMITYFKHNPVTNSLIVFRRSETKYDSGGIYIVFNNSSQYYILQNKDTPPGSNYPEEYSLTKKSSSGVTIDSKILSYKPDLAKMYFINGCVMGSVGSKLEIMVGLDGVIKQDIPATVVYIDALFYSGVVGGTKTVNITTGSYNKTFTIPTSDGVAFSLSIPAGQSVTATVTSTVASKRTISGSLDSPYFGNNEFEVEQNTNIVKTFSPTRNYRLTGAVVPITEVPDYIINYNFETEGIVANIRFTVTVGTIVRELRDRGSGSISVPPGTSVTASVTASGSGSLGSIRRLVVYNSSNSGNAYDESSPNNLSYTFIANSNIQIDGSLLMPI